MSAIKNSLIYIVMFAVVIFCSAINDNNLHGKRKKSIHTISAGVIIVIPAIMAGLRNPVIGTDTQVYAIPLFKAAVGSSTLESVITAMPRIEVGFSALAFGISRFTNDYGIFLFAIAFIIQLFVYLSIYRMHETHSILIAEVLYLCFFFNASLSMMRQMIAASIILFGTTYLRQNKYLHFVFWFLIAYEFHNSALLGLVFVPIHFMFSRYSMVNSVKEIGAKIWKYRFSIALMVFLAFFIRIAIVDVVTYMVNQGILKPLYLAYVHPNDRFSTPTELFILYPMVYLALFMKKNKNYEAFAICILDLLFYYMQSINFYMYRLGTYYMTVRILSLSEETINYYRLIKYKKIEKNRGLRVIYILLISFICWFFFYAVNNQNQTMPYYFR